MLKKCYFNRINIGMIPSAYSEALTYEEQILWLQTNLNKCIEWLTQLQEDFDNIDLNFEEIQREINLIQEHIETIDSSITNLEDTKADKTELASAISNIRIELEQLIESSYNVLKGYVDTQDENLQYQIDHFDINKIKVYDPTTGLLEEIQVVIDNIYDQTRDEAITTGEFDLLELTATEYDSKELTAFNFDRYGKTLLEE